MLSTIPFEIPAKFAAQLATGDLVRYGGLLKDVGTGQIVAHLQETGIAQSVLSSLVSGAPTPLSLVSGCPPKAPFRWSCSGNWRSR